MRRPHNLSIAPPIVWGTILIVSTVALIALWNVVIVTDYLHLRRLAADQVAMGSGRWAILVVGCVLFLGVLVGLLLFLISLVKQIRLNRAQQNFIDSVTHEFKTPLTSLKLHLQTLQRGRVTPERQAEFFQIMLADVERLSLLLEHILEAARLGRRSPVTLEDVPLRALLDDIAVTIRSRYGLPDGAIALDGADATVKSEPTALHMVFLNLVDNAVKYSGDDVSVQLHIEPVTTGGATVRVQDRGVGIPRDQLKRIFQRFYRVGSEMTRTRPGTGIGLYIVRETVLALGGRVSAQSAGSGCGSTFTVVLPGDSHG
jgi:signal transduction histidine kinase